LDGPIPPPATLVFLELAWLIKGAFELARTIKGTLGLAWMIKGTPELA
jgi:hypothetical protein